MTGLIFWRAISWYCQVRWKLQMPFSDIAWTMLLVAAFLGGLVILGAVIHFVFGGLARAVRKLVIPDSSQVQATPKTGGLGTRPFSGLDTLVFTKPAWSGEREAARRAVMNTLGVTEFGGPINSIEDEMIYTFAPSVAGVEKVETLNGSAEVTEGNRCIVISDRHQLLILDCTNNRGIRLEPSEGWMETSVEGSIVRVALHPKSGATAAVEVFTIDAHAADRKSWLPVGWSGTFAQLGMPSDEKT